MFIQMFGREIPAYGMLIVLGVILANITAFIYLKKVKYDTDHFLVLEAYCFLGAFVGAKLLFILVSFDKIQWSRILEPEYFNSLMQGGFVFYGGMIGGLLFALMAGKLHKIDAIDYIRHLIFLIPFIHAFGRIGCHCVGCCYGRPYSGPGAVVYSENQLAPPGISLFPVQLLEAVLLLVIAVILIMLTLKNKFDVTVPTYFISYGIVRFILEFLRGDDLRGSYAFLSTSQWISLLLILAGCYLLRRKRRTA